MKFNDPAVIIFIGVSISVIGAIIGGLGAFLSTRQQTEGQIELRQKSDEIATLNREIATAQKDLREKSDEISKINKDIAATITGGDSYCYLDIYTPSKDSNVVDLLLLHKGKYPSYDVTVTIVDHEKRMMIFKSAQEKGKIPYSSMTEAWAADLESTKQIYLGNVGPNTARVLNGLVIPDTDILTYEITVMARNGSVHQFVRFRRVNGAWKAARKYTYLSGSQEIRVDPDYPRDLDGRGIW